MTNSFKEDDIRQIVSLIQALDKSTFDFLQLEVGGVKVTLGKGEVPAPEPRVVTHAVAATAAPIEPTQPQAPDRLAPKTETRSDGIVPIVAPIMGVFYPRSDPTSSPFVAVGATVDAESTVALIEVMKVFNAVHAGVAGIVSEICVEEGQFVEFGQVLFRVRPVEHGAKQAGS